MMTKLKISTRIAAGFSAVILTTLLLGVAIYMAMGQVEKYAKSITSDSMPGVYQIGQLQSDMQSNLSLLLQQMQATNPSETQQIADEMAQMKDRITSDLSEYEKTIFIPKDRELFDAIKEARQPYVRCLFEIVKLNQEKKPQKARELFTTQLLPLFQKFSLATKAEVDFNRNNADIAGAGILSAIHFVGDAIFIGLAITILAAIGVTFITARSISSPIGVFVGHLKQIAGGDLSFDAPKAFLIRGDEIGDMARAKQSMIDNLRAMTREIGDGINTLSSSSTELSSNSTQMMSGSRHASHKAHSVAAAAHQMSANITTVATGMEQTSTNLACVAAATEQMTSTISEIARNSATARRITDEAKLQAENITVQINLLGQAAREIGKVTETITEISSQTNLLALNATIEAARAGTAGKGFAVVATEIKALAQQTAAATGDIRSRIEAVQNATSIGITEVGKASLVIQDVSSIVTSISAAIAEQTTVTRDIARNVAEASTGVRDANLHIAESSNVSREIAKDIADVDLAAGEMASGGDSVRLSAGELSSVAERLKLTASRFHI